MNPQDDHGEAELRHLRYRRALRATEEAYGRGSEEVRGLKYRFRRAARRRAEGSSVSSSREF